MLVSAGREVGPASVFLVEAATGFGTLSKRRRNATRLTSNGAGFARTVEKCAWARRRLAEG